MRSSRANEPPRANASPLAQTSVLLKIKSHLLAQILLPKQCIVIVISKLQYIWPALLIAMVRANVLTEALKGSEITRRTVFVPRSQFPHRHDPKVELSIQEDTKFAHTYLEQDLNRKPYVVHDGPPFANGPIHLGHAINKILKDIAARHAMITGHKVEFITGWDCHGLPIELQVNKLIEEQQRQSNYGGSLAFETTTSPEHFRTKARAYAKSQIDLQMASFKRMGLLTDWNKRYTTDDPAYVANQLRAFSQLFEQKLIFRDLMPVHWSLVNKTSVADADIDYRSNHISKSAYVLYEIIDPPFFGADVPKQPLYALIWTTTPWTLLENKAIAFNKQETYCIVKAWRTTRDGEKKNFLVSFDTKHKLGDLLQRLGYEYEMSTYVPGRSLTGLKYKPLLNDLAGTQQDTSARPFLDADFVDGAKGTGLVHTAPNYGFEDYSLIKKHKLAVGQTLVDYDGRFRQEAGDILAGKYIFSDGTQETLSLLDQHRALFFTEMTQHSYPYETRTNQPVIIRTSQQTFLDTSRIVPRCIKALESCSFFPESRRLHLINTLASSPSWCISRQRLWGTPIPVLYEKDDINKQKMISHPLLVEHFCKLLYKKRFIDYWWTVDNSEIIPQELLDKCKLPYKSDDLVRGTDIFDVWSDSGLSWHTVSNGLNDAKNQADLYLEGTDQIRGWFSASSILSMALRGCLPTKRFFLHGFAVDKNGRKMSKSQGNVVDPAKLFELYGVDPIRLWAAKNAGGNRDIVVRHSEFKASINETVSKIRNTFKYLIGALADHDAVDGKLDHTKLTLFDQYYLNKLYRFASTMDEHYKSYRYDIAVDEINRFLTLDFSPNYITTIKDILYCDELTTARRQSCLTVLNLAYNILLRCTYPITPHIVHEAAGYMRTAEPLNEWKDLGYKAAWRNDVLHGQMETLIQFKSLFIRVMSSKVGNMRNADVVLYIDDKRLFKKLSKICNSEPELMMELFRTCTFNLSLKDKMSVPDDVTETQVCDEYTAQPIDESSDKDGDFSDEDAENAVNINLLTAWSKSSGVENNEYWAGGQLLTSRKPKSKPIRFEFSSRKSANRKCVRCRRYNVLDISEHVNVCDRCKQILEKFELQN